MKTEFSIADGIKIKCPTFPEIIEKQETSHHQIQHPEHRAAY
jgi:hypothetical protein